MNKHFLVIFNRLGLREVSCCGPYESLFDAKEAANSYVIRGIEDKRERVTSADIVEIVQSGNTGLIWNSVIDKEENNV